MRFDSQDLIEFPGTGGALYLFRVAFAGQVECRRIYQAPASQESHSCCHDRKCAAFTGILGCIEASCGADSEAAKSRPGSLYVSGFSNTPSTTENIVVTAPIPSARARIANAANAFSRERTRSACLISINTLSLARGYNFFAVPGPPRDSTGYSRWTRPSPLRPERAARAYRKIECGNSGNGTGPRRRCPAQS